MEFAKRKLVLCKPFQYSESNRSNIILIDNNLTNSSLSWVSVFLCLDKIDILLGHVKDIRVLCNKRTDKEGGLRIVEVECNYAEE